MTIGLNNGSAHGGQRREVKKTRRKWSENDSAVDWGRIVANVISADIGGPAKMTDVPNGRWAGVWTGYEVTAVCGYGKWKFTTDEGVRGIGIGCIVTANHGRITVDVHHPELP